MNDVFLIDYQAMFGRVYGFVHLPCDIHRLPYHLSPSLDEDCWNPLSEGSCGPLGRPRITLEVLGVHWFRQRDPIEPRTLGRHECSPVAQGEVCQTSRTFFSHLLVARRIHTGIGLFYTLFTFFALPSAQVHNITTNPVPRLPAHSFSHFYNILYLYFNF